MRHNNDTPYTLLEMPGRISTDPDIEDAVFCDLAVKITSRGQHYLLNLHLVKHLSSPILRLLIRLGKHASEYGCRLFIINARQPLWDALLAAKVHKLIPIFPTLLDYEIYQMDTSLIAA